ncbi:phosphatidylserine decarboxylase [Pleurotus eryngii]|uniref:Phosphatidylserine decarboxylase proenzyme 1, mitochondrial n=1 Tax=Pleurotus eryngii TaxID=5323 RepID=A0A9P5ZPQ6_PLEER|nr:phosphatidylserine decarboxylase [Pleurotus eryngii]
MLISRKNLLTHGRKPLHAATKVLSASTATASTLARCWVHGTNKTSALISTVRGDGFRKQIRRAYSSTRGSAGGDPGSINGPGVDTSTMAKGMPLYRKVMDAWTQTPTKWYPLPIAVGALLLVALQYRRKSRRSKEVQLDENGMEIIKLKGPWQVHVLGALPLRNMSRVWGYVNSLELPVWFRPIGFRLYSFAFGCDLDEIEHSDDLTQYVSLGDFFYRKLKDGARPVDPAVLVSPADGRILHLGAITDHKVEQVKGITYSLDALLGIDKDHPPVYVPAMRDPDLSIVDDQEFADINGIEYTLDQLIGTSSPSTSSTPSSSSARRNSDYTGTQTPGSESDSEEVRDPHAPPKKFGKQVDASVVDLERDLKDTLAHDASVALEMGVKTALDRRRSMGGKPVKPGNQLFFTVIYLAPGDYHRFHSPTAWVVEKRRHFVGELFSVSPYMAKRLENLFVLNERVALLGRWKYGFFSMVPVGATNVGSIKVNFDQALRTNLRGKPPPPGTYAEAVYSAASPILNGQPLTPAQEMGGFCLGSTIVLVFEAPESFEFSVHPGQKVKVGQRLGNVVDADSSKVKTE